MTRSCFAFGVCVLVAGSSLGVGACSASSNGGFAPNDPPSSSSSGSGSQSGSGGGSTSGAGSSGSYSSSSGTASSSGAHSSSSGSGGTSSGSTSGGSSSGGHTSSGGTASSSGVLLDASYDVAPPPPYDGGPQPCGSQECDLKTSTCCVAQNPASSTCVSHGTSCPFLTAGFSCLAATDCSGSGMVCCGVATTTSANTMCQSVAQGQSCQPSTADATMGSAQLCISSAECTMGQQCIAQTCLQGSQLRLCGLHSSAPFNCTAN